MHASSFGYAKQRTVRVTTPSQVFGIAQFWLCGRRTRGVLALFAYLLRWWWQAVRVAHSASHRTTSTTGTVSGVDLHRKYSSSARRVVPWLRATVRARSSGRCCGYRCVTQSAVPLQSHSDEHFCSLAEQILCHSQCRTRSPDRGRHSGSGIIYYNEIRTGRRAGYIV